MASVGLSSFFVFQNAFAATGINQQISFQGKVVNSNGTNVTNGSYTFVFRLYDVDTAGTHIWTESKSLTVTDGIFQTNLGDTTALPGSVDFNTDNIYLGINFNGDGEMSPRVHFTAAPYAFNAKKVGGLTVTDTTGTLTIPNGKTISFADAFTTTGAFPLTLTSTASTTATLPSGTITLADLTTAQSLTNKTIGSTGLVFSGATTDITTATNEDLNITANGSGDIVIAVDSGTFVNLTGGTDGTGTLTVAAGDVTLSDGDLIVSGGDANFTLDVADTFNVIKSSANAGDVVNITASSVNAFDGLQLDLTATADSGADNVTGLDVAWTESADADVWTAINLPNTTTTNSATRALVVGTGYDTILDSANLDISGAGAITGATGITSSGTITFSSISGSTQCLHVDSSGVVTGTGSDCGAGGGGSLDASYTTGNTITTDSGNNVIITLQEVVTPTSFVVENQDTAGVSATRIYNSIASGTLTNGLLLEQTGAGTMTNAIQIAETAGTITDGILVTGTLGNILNSPTLDITGAGAITGATAITSSGTITFSGLSTAGIVTNTSGGVLGTTISVPIANGGTNATSVGSAGSIAYSTGTAYAFSAVGTAGQALVSGGTGAPTFFAPTAGSVVFAGTSGILEQDNASFFFDNSTNRLGLGTTSPAAQLSILGSSNALRLSYDVSNYASLSTASDGTLSLTSSNTSESQFVIGTGASVDDSIGFDGASQDYYAGLDHTTGYFTIGTGFTVGSSTLLAIDSTGNIGIGTGVTAPGARLDLSLVSTNTTADTLYAQRNVLSDTGVVTSGTDTTYGVNTSVTRTGATGGTINTYGNYISVTADNAGSGTSTAYGLYAAVSGADTNYAGIFTGGNVGVGDVTPDNPFEITSTSQQLRLSYTDGSVDGAIYVDSSEYLTLVAGTTSEVNRVQVGAGGAGNSTPDLFGLDVKSDTGDPAGGFEGAMYYNTSDNVFRCYQNSGWTNCIGTGGSGGDLQTAYDADADGSNVTISLTAADDGLIFTNPSSSGNNLSTFLLQLDQANTTANMLALDIVQSSNASNAVNLTANSIDGETGLAITTNGLTSGKGISIASSATAFTGNLADITLSGSNAANTGNVLAVSNTGTASANTALFVDHRATGTGNLAMRVDDESSDTTPFIIDGEGRVGIGTTAMSANAATERLLQIGSETNRGSMAAYGDVVSVGLDRHTALTGITDVFVYDTTGDSDGGRWVDWATTDNLSWYTESLDDGPDDPCDISSDDRCYKKSFPRKAILVVTTSALYIFDAATNDMWMKFSQNASGYALGVDTNNDPSSVTALNGVIYVGLRGTATTSLYAIDFVNDRIWNYDGTDRSGADTGISGRNAAVTYNVDNNTKLDLAVTGTAANWQNVNDVYAAVITHSISAAAIGGTTNTTPGNGKVFVALATDAGVTVINLTAGTLNQYSDVTDDDYTAVVISRRGYLYALNTTQDQLERWDTMDTDKASEVNGTYTRKWDETIATGPAIASSAFNVVFPGPDNLEIAERASLTLDSEDVIYAGHSLGLAELHDHTTQAFGWVKYFNSTRQTPMMPVAGINDMVLPMDDTSGTQAQDLAIANTDMAIKGTPTLGVNGVAGKAINFDNTDDYLCSDADQNNTCDVDTAFNMSTVGWTFSIWFRHSTTAPASGVDMIFEKCVTAAPAQATGCVAAYMTTTGTVVVANDDDATWTQGSSYDLTATSTYTYNDNQWHHLVISRTNANDVDSWIDGNGMNLSNATGNTITLDGSQIVTIGASCSTTTGANCAAANALNFWDGQLDDAQFLVGTTTQATLSALQVRRLYNVERPRVSKKTITVTDATSATSTSLTDTGESWNVNEFAGLIVEITGSSDTDCVGITRRITGNTATALTFTPAVPGACTLDTSADFEVDPEALYGGSSSVAGIGITAESPLGEARQMCIGTNSGSDTGGVTCYNHQAGPSIVADVYHSQASQTDDTGTDWTGSNYDEMVAIDLSTRTLLMASEAHITSITETVRLGQGLDYLANQLYMIRQEIVLDGITAVGSTASEVGFTGGADLAENYYSDTPLEAGTVVALDATQPAYVAQTTGAYQRDMLGVVATSPGIVLGDPSTNGYPVALVGRVPVKVTNENGPIYAGDRLTSASRAGYAMRAYQSGRVLGEVLSDAVDWAVCDGEDPLSRDALLCTTVLVFVNLTDYTGQSVELAMASRDTMSGADGLSGSATLDGAEQGLGSETESIRLATSMPTKQEHILAFLKELRAKQVASARASSEVFTGRVSASTEVITPALYADQIFAKSIKADSIEGLSIWTNQIASLEQKYAGLQVANEGQSSTYGTAPAPSALTNLEQFTVGSFRVTLDASILGKLALAGGMTVGGEAQFGGETTFAKLTSFFGKTLFKGVVSFEQSPLFGGDTAGFATIEEGARKVRVTFETPYEKQPIVTATLTNDASPLLSEADETLKQDIEVLEKEYLDSVFDKDIRYLVTEKSPRGFTIVLAEKAPRHLQFSWVALSVDKAKSFNSEKEKVEEVIPTDPIPAPQLVPDVPVDSAFPLPEAVTSETEPVPALVSPEATTP